MSLLQNAGLKTQMVNFAFSGSLTTGIMFVLYVALKKVMNYQLAYLIAYCVSVVILYFINVRYVFNKEKSLRTFLQFPFIYLLQYLVGAVSLKFLVEFGISVTYAPLLVVILLLPVTFLLNRALFFKKLEH